MLMTNENIKLYPHDKLFYRFFVRFLPASVEPNDLTKLRFILTPFVWLMLWDERWAWALSIFAIAALTDAMDGTLARMRKQITMWGTVADPTADKILIGSVVVLFVAREVNITFAAIIILMECLIVASAIYRKRKGITSSANNYGKVKMILQVAGVGMLLVAKLMGVETAVPFAVGTLSLAIAFALVSLLTYGF